MPVIICQGWRRKTNSAYIECNVGKAQNDCNCNTAVFADKWQAGYCPLQGWLKTLAFRQRMINIYA